jgi:hypothetical protein
VRVPVEPAYVKSIIGVPLIIKFVVVPQDQIVVAFPANEIFPVPKLIVRALLFDDENIHKLRVYEPNDKVPAVKVNVPDDAPERVALPDNAKVISDLLTVEVKQAAVAVTVTTAEVPEFESKIVVSAAFGALAPEAPPLEVDQFAVDELSQVPSPPTQ